MDGSPIPDMKLSVSGALPPKKAYTDTAGNYLLTGLQSGVASVVLSGGHNQRPIYLFQQVRVDPEESETANFVVETNANIRGDIAAAEGTVRSGSVSVHPFDENAVVLEGIRYAMGISNQKFSVDSVPPGQYFLWSSGNASNGRYSLWQRLFLERGDNPVHLAVPAGMIRGQVMNPAAGPVGGVGLELLPMLENIRVPQSLYNSLTRQSYSSSDGGFAFPNLQPGGYQMLFQDPTRPPQSSWMALPPVYIGPNQGVTDYRVNVGQ
jgi:hypothetical protein